MIRKSVQRFSERIMPGEELKRDLIALWALVVCVVLA